MPRARRTPEFQALWNQLKTSATTHKPAAALVDALAEAIVDLETRPCDGSRLRGPRMHQICEWRLPVNRRFRAWRILYRIGLRSTPELLLFGEHYLPITAASYSRPTYPRNRLGVKLRIADPYLTLALDLRLTRAELLQLERDLQAPPRSCC
jgi:hypothetical protein